MNNIEAVYYTEIQPEIITLKSDKRYYVQGYISTTDIDLANEVLTENAQRDLHNQIQTIIKSGGFITGDVEHMIFYDDNGKALSMPKVRDSSGSLIIPEMKIIDSELRDKGVWVKAEINRHHPNFNTIWKNIEEGFLNGFSVAVKAITTITKKINNEWVNLIDKIKLINVTMTGTPANPNALMSPVLKSLIQDKKGDLMEYDALTDEQKKDYDALENDEDKKAFLKKCGESDSVKKSIDHQEEVSDVKEAKVDETEDKDVPELKSALTTLKSEITTLKSNLEQLNTYNSELKTELKAVTERLEKIESQPIKKSLVADKSKMLGSFENTSMKEFNAIDLI